MPFYCFFVIYYFFVRSKIEILSKTKFHEESKINKTLITIFHGFIEITLNNTKKYFTKIFLSSISKHIKSVRFIQFLSLTPRFILELIVVLIIFIYFNFKNLNENQILEAMPIFGLYIFAGYRILPSLNRMNNYVMAIKSVKIALDYIFTETQKIKNKNLNTKIVKKIDKVSLKNINYIYPETTTKVFKRNINLTFESGNCYGLVGDSGSGKSI